jgi:RsiW-degrading membrane proteinase PrsW (M82 family)
VEAQAFDTAEPSNTSASRASRAFGVPWRWSLLLFLGLITVVGVNAAILADEVRTQRLSDFHAPPGCPGCRPVYAEPSELMWAAAFAIALATVASIPALAVVGWLGRRVGVRPSAIAATALLAGVLMSGVAVRLVTWSSRWLADGAGATLASVVVGPTIEEVAKASALLIIGLVMGWRLGVRPGIVLGAAAGLIVTILEIAIYVQLSYVGGTNTAYGTVIAIRLGLFGLGVHVVASAIAGVGVGAWLAQDPPRRPRVLVACLAAASAIHGLWNLVGSTLMTFLVLTLYPEPDVTLAEAVPLSVLFVASSVTQLVVLAIPIAGLVIAWRRDAERAAPPPSTSPLVEGARP